MAHPLIARLRAARRDWTMVVGGLRGATPPPFHTRDGARWPTTRAPRPENQPLSAPSAAASLSPASFTAAVTVRLDGVETHFSVAAGLSILAAAEDAGVLLPHSCAVGGCGACACVLVTGSVAVPEDACLTDGERAEGLILTCVGRPTSPIIVLEYD